MPPPPMNVNVILVSLCHVSLVNSYCVVLQGFSIVHHKATRLIDRDRREPPQIHQTRELAKTKFGVVYHEVFIVLYSNAMVYIQQNGIYTY